MIPGGSAPAKLPFNATTRFGYHKSLEKIKSTRTRVAVIVLINLVSLTALAWTLRDAKLGNLRHDFAALNGWWVLAAIATQLSVYLWQALRWKQLLAPVVVFRFWQTVQAIFAGLFISELMPFRGGEVVRCYLVSRWTGLPFSVSLTSVLIERVFDGLLMWLALQSLLDTARFPPSFAYGSDGLGAVVLAGVVIFALALFSPEPKGKQIPARGWRRRFWVLRSDLAHIGHSWSLCSAFLLTIPYLLFQAVPIWVLSSGYGFNIPVGAAIALMMLLRLAAAFPQAPATLGLFQLITKEFLEYGYSIPAADAARFSLLLWAVVKLPLLAAGAIALSITGSKIGELTQAAAERARTGESREPE